VLSFQLPSARACTALDENTARNGQASLVKVAARDEEKDKETRRRGDKEIRLQTEFSMSPGLHLSQS
jgi:hypothetical protein